MKQVLKLVLMLIKFLPQLFQILLNKSKDIIKKNMKNGKDLKASTRENRKKSVVLYYDLI